VRLIKGIYRRKLYDGEDMSSKPVISITKDKVLSLFGTVKNQEKEPEELTEQQNIERSIAYKKKGTLLNTVAGDRKPKFLPKISKVLALTEEKKTFCEESDSSISSRQDYSDRSFGINK